HEEQPVVRSSGVTDFVYCLDHRIQSGVKTNRDIRCKNVVVNCFRNADDSDAMLGRKFLGAAKRSIATDDNQCFYAAGFNLCGCFLSFFFILETAAARGFQDGASALKDVAYTAGVHFNKLSVDQTIVAMNNTV